MDSTTTKDSQRKKERNSVNHDIPCPVTSYLHLKNVYKAQKK